MNFSIDIKGMKQVEKAFKEIGADLSEKVVMGALRDAAKPVHAEMQRLVPIGDRSVKVKNLKGLNRRVGEGEDAGVVVTPGQLRSRIKIRGKKAVSKRTGKVSRGAGKGEIGRVRVGFFSAYYGYFVEYGTSSQPPQPFIRPAIESKSGVAVQTFNKRIKHRIELTRRKLAREARKANK